MILFSASTQAEDYLISQGMPTTASSVYQDRANDEDGDGVRDRRDNCPTIANDRQYDLDDDGLGDACDDDIDGDGFSNAIDLCPLNDNPRCDVLVSVGMSASASSVYRDRDYQGPQVAVDGVINRKLFRSKNEDSPWWEVDLGEGGKMISEVVIHNRAGLWASRMSNFDVKIMDDNRTVKWSSYQESHPNYTLSLETGDYVWARYVRVQLRGSGILHMKEVEVYGRARNDTDWDGDGDGIADENDICPNDNHNNCLANTGGDFDNDGTANGVDYCPSDATNNCAANPDGDSDNDGIPNASEMAASNIPPTPSDRDSIMLIEDNQYKNPHIPPSITTADGRISMSHKDKYLRLHVPEKIKGQPFYESSAGINIYADSTYPLSFRTEGSIFEQSPQSPGRNVHHAFCDPTAASDSKVKNPYQCGDSDCYDLTMIGARIKGEPNGGEYTFVGTPITVTVDNPKTAQASISDVTYGEPVKGSTFILANQFFEPFVSADGKLYFFRVGVNQAVTWKDSQGKMRSTQPDVVYMVNDNPDEFAPCDVTQWNKILPLPHAPYDDTINTRYGFAMNKFRDMRGNTIPEIFPNLGSYPWIDKKGDNISVTMGGALNVFDDQQNPFPVKCAEAEDDCLNQQESAMPAAGAPLNRVILGLWTNGKMVKMDNDVNHADFSLRSQDGAHRMVQLYAGTNSHDGWIRIGGTRDNNLDNQPALSSQNTNFFDTLENRFNYFDNLKPTRVQDVVWTLNSGNGATVDFAFDDYTNPDSFIISPMNHMTEHANNTQAVIQNAATAPATRWAIPPEGDLRDGRVEKVALGGVQGRGLWFNGTNTRLGYEIKEQPQEPKSSSWFVGLFVKMNYQMADQSLIVFPDDTSIRLNADGTLKFLDAKGEEVRSLTTPYTVVGEWVHFGFQLSDANRVVETYVNGFLLDTYSVSGSIFNLEPGTLWLGKTWSGSQYFSGWMDEFKIIAQKLNSESICNQAYGSLAALDDNASSAWYSTASQYPAMAHEQVQSETSIQSNSFVCYRDPSDFKAINVRQLPQGLLSVRDSIHFPEGPLYWDAPRPNSAQNQFCLSCHVVEGKKGLSIDALIKIPGVDAADDHRRQPMQPEPVVYGHVPENWLGEGKPLEALGANPDGLKIDQYVLPSIDGND